MGKSKNYYISSIFWSTLSKILNAALGFVSVPLLLQHYGKAEYGLLSIAIACNGYMHLLDLGINTGAIKYYSQWNAEGKQDKTFRVARSNITFYFFIALINIGILLSIACWGENMFSVTHNQFHQIRLCLYVIASFCVFSWVTTVFNQLLVANQQMAYTMKVQCFQTFLKGIAIILALCENITLTKYFLLVTAAVSFAVLPYGFRCLKKNYIDSLRPAWYWNDFKEVFIFSLSIFTLSFFQVSASQSRPILLSMFANDSASVVADYRIIEVVPNLIIMITGTFSGVFLPKTSEMVARKETSAIKDFVYKWTTYTTVITVLISFPFILCSNEVLSAYVGSEYCYLSKWFTIWCLTVLVQMHTTPANSLVLAHGQTKLIVRITAIASVLSMILNVFLCRNLGIGSAIISYFLYVLTIIGMYYVCFYKKMFNLSRLMVLKKFVSPVILAVVVLIPVSLLPIDISLFGLLNERVAYILLCMIKSLIWIIPYIKLLFVFKIIDIQSFKNK
jgi:O-antigen/teichoic acid export membrane protein